MNITSEKASSIGDYINKVIDFSNKNKGMKIYFRGEKDYGKDALTPSIYRDSLLEHEHRFYQEISRFNDKDFDKDKTTLDRLCRMQHFGCPTRLLDLSEDCLTSLYFALEGENKTKNQTPNPPVVYLFAITKDKIKYYDSDSVTILANLAKLPLKKDNNPSPYGDKSKTKLVTGAEKMLEKTVKNYNKDLSFLLHEIKNDKPHMQPLINLGDIFSVQCVKTKLSNERIFAQKGAFLLFGLNIHDVEKRIPLDGSYMEPSYWQPKYGTTKWIGTPIVEIMKIEIEKNGITMETLESLGISTPYIYPNMKEIGEYYKQQKP